MISNQKHQSIPCYVPPEVSISIRKENMEMFKDYGWSFEWIDS